MDAKVAIYFPLYMCPYSKVLSNGNFSMSSAHFTQSIEATIAIAPHNKNNGIAWRLPVDNSSFCIAIIMA